MTPNLNDGRQIKQVFWPDTETEKGRCMTVDVCRCEKLIFACDYHGDWIIETREGVEVARHNARYVETIKWMDTADAKQGSDT